MPNTLCHIGIQAPLNGIVLQKQDLLWVVIACIIPDIPWITLKLLLSSGAVSPYEARLYCTAQASFLFALILSGAVALLMRSSAKIFLILTVNCFFHLALDSMQIKWGNGVHIIAPLSWEMFHIDLFWPEFVGTIILTGVGFSYLLLNWEKLRKNRIFFTHHRVKLLASFFLIAAYLTGPLHFKPQLEAADTYYIATMRNVAERTGKPIELDRARYQASTRKARVYTGETFTLTGTLPAESGRVSFRGVFTTPDTIVCSDYHRSSDYRDYVSLLGLFMACVLLIQSLLFANFRKDKSQ